MLGLRYWHVIMVKGSVILLAAMLDVVTLASAASREAAAMSHPPAFRFGTSARRF
jgi:hypothetical protein